MEATGRYVKEHGVSLKSRNSEGFILSCIWNPTANNASDIDTHTHTHTHTQSHAQLLMYTKAMLSCCQHIPVSLSQYFLQNQQLNAAYQTVLLTKARQNQAHCCL